MNITATAYAGVAVTTVTLFLIGTPAQRGRELALNAPPPPASKTAAPAVATGTPAAQPVVTAAGVTLRSVSFDFPTSDRAFPGGDSAAIVTNNCTACHSPGMILTQPSLTKAGWEEEVNKMRTTYKAPVDAADVPAIADYLAGIKGKS